MVLEKYYIITLLVSKISISPVMEQGNKFRQQVHFLKCSSLRTPSQVLFNFDKSPYPQSGQTPGQLAFPYTKSPIETEQCVKSVKS